MNGPLPVFLFGVLALVLAFTSPSQAVITVNGIDDEDIENDWASLTVPSEVGFTIVAQLNGDPITLETPIAITAPGYYELTITKTNDTDASEESRTLQFIVLDSSRGTSERDGLQFSSHELRAGNRGGVERRRGFLTQGFLGLNFFALGVGFLPPDPGTANSFVNHANPSRLSWSASLESR